MTLIQCIVLFSCLTIYTWAEIVWSLDAPPSWTLDSPPSSLPPKHIYFYTLLGFASLLTTYFSNKESSVKT